MVGEVTATFYANKLSVRKAGGAIIRRVTRGEGKGRGPTWIATGGAPNRRLAGVMGSWRRHVGRVGHQGVLFDGRSDTKGVMRPVIDLHHSMSDKVFWQSRLKSCLLHLRSRVWNISQS